MSRILDAMKSCGYWAVTVVAVWVLSLAWLVILAISCVVPRFGDKIRESVRDPYERRWRDE